MKCNLLTFKTILIRDNFLRVDVRKHDQSVYSGKPVDMARVEQRSREMLNMLNQTGKEGSPNPNFLREIQTSGTILADELLPADIMHEICRSDAEFLVAEIDDNLAHLPWELLYVGEDFLCRRFSMGRIIAVSPSFLKSGPRRISHPAAMWILANPQSNLINANTEGKLLDEMIRNNSGGISHRLSRGRTTHIELIENIRNYDMVHFAGHAEYDPDLPERCGWKMADAIFSAKDISGMTGGKMPAFVFSNACQSARTEDWKSGELSLVKAFLNAGASHYIGTFWKIMDEPGSRFALEFYRRLLAGTPVGTAVKLSRQALEDASDWASYILYGDPEFCAVSAEDASSVIRKPLYSIPKNGRKDRSGNSTDSQTPNPVSSKPSGAKHLMTICISGFCLLAVMMAWLMFRSSPPEHSPPALNPDVSRMLTEQIEKKQARIRSLLNDLSAYPQPAANTDVSDGWTSEPVFMAMIYDSAISHHHRETEALIAHAIQSRIKDQYPRIRLLDRKNLDNILEEITMERPETLELLTADLFVFIEVNMAESKIHVLMRLEQKKTGEITDFFIETPEEDKSLLSQRDALAENLISALKGLYPLQGKISEISGKDVMLNIGYDAGVRVNQEFHAADGDIVLKVVSVSPESAVSVSDKAADTPIIGMKVKAMF